MEKPNDFQLLDDDDDIMTSNFNAAQNYLTGSLNSLNMPPTSTIKIQNKSSNSSITVNNRTASVQVQRPSVLKPPRTSQFKISSNNPKANSMQRLELKSIERPRSHSPLKMSGIEEYIQLYANNVLANSKRASNQTSSQTQINKITMNLKMDDLLSNVKNENNSYQMLSDFSFLTGDSDTMNEQNKFGVKPKKRTKSLDASNLGDSDWLNNKIRDLNEINRFTRDDEDADDSPADDNEEETSSQQNDGNLKYKYTATYKKDETGLFKEQSKIVFESKSDRAFQAFSKANFPTHTNTKEDQEDMDEFEAKTKLIAKQQLEAALDALRNNSKNIEAKMDKIDDITIPMPQYESNSEDSAFPKSLNKLRANTKISNLESNIENGLSLIKNIIDSNPSKQQPPPPQPPQELAITPAIKKNNDQFFNEFLMKSDDLIAQTQSKLDKLGKLESINKPLAPKPQTSISTASATHLSMNETNINNSRSLIDLKSTEVSAASPAAVNAAATNQIDLLFDMNEQSLGFALNDTPIKQNESYFDLIGISSCESAATTTHSTMPKVPSELFGLNYEFINGSSSSRTTTPLTSPYKDVLLEDFFGTQPIQETAKFNSNIKMNDLINSLYSAKKSKDNMSSIVEAQEENDTQKLKHASINNIDIPSIDILITEPMNEMNDNNIVPDDFFNMRHEIPNDQSRSHSPDDVTAAIKDKSRSASPSNLSQNTNSSLNNLNFPHDFNNDSISKTTLNETSQQVSTSITNSIIRSRPVSPRPKTADKHSDTELIMSEIESAHIIPKTPQTPGKFSKKPVKAKITKFKKSSPSQSVDLSSSSFSSDDDEGEQKFQIRIRPKSQKKTLLDNKDNQQAAEKSPIPLLPKPPKSAQELEAFKQRRFSSGAESITKSLKEGTRSDSDDEVSDQVKQVASQVLVSKNRRASERKESVQSEYNLELPDEDDLAPLDDFNEKCELNKYPDGSYGCILLVRQPFRNPNLMYKNALQKMTEVRTWTECLVKLVDSATGKKLAFYNAHELMSIAAEHEIPLDKVIAEAVINSDEQSGNKKQEKSFRSFYADEAETSGTGQPKEEENSNAIPKVLPFHEFELKASYKFGDLTLQQYDAFSKIHTFKMQDIIFKETIQIRPDRILALPERFMKRFTKPKVSSLMDHTPLPFEICKFGHLNYSYLRSFLLLLQVNNLY